MKHTLAVVTLSAGIIFCGGCGGGNILPDDWDKQIPGTYIGFWNPYKEVVVFQTNGTFIHTVYDRSVQIYIETGNWSVTPKRWQIDLSAFMQFYSPLNNEFSTNGQPFGSYVYSPVEDSREFDKISASVEYQYSLRRQPNSPRLP